MPTPLSPLPWWRRLALPALALLLALAFLGSRGIWDPDEGRYTNVAMNMLASGDWIDLSRHHETGHWTKPPATYWAIAASIATFGASAWAARLPVALAYLLSTWLAWRLARRLQPGSETTAAVAYATMLLPFMAANLVTTDFLLAAFQGLAMLAWAESRFGPPERAARWTLLMCVGFALAFLTKGPPALLPLLAVAALQWLAPSGRRGGGRALLLGLLVFAALALPWFVAVVLRHPGLLSYFLGTEVVARFASASLDRNAEWYGWLKVYAPTLLLGTLPWTPALWRWARALPARLHGWRDPAARRADAPHLALLLWLALPLLVFCLARSRLPLYLLPLFLPLALLVARQRLHEGRALPRLRWLLAWVVVLLGLRLLAANWDSHKDASTWAEAIRERNGAPVAEVAFVEDMARYGLHLHLGSQVEKISLEPRPAEGFMPEYDSALAGELAEREPGVVWVTKAAAWPAVRARIEALGYRAEALGTPFQGRVIFRVAPAPESAAAPDRDP